MTARTRLYYNVLRSNAQDTARKLAERVSRGSITPDGFRAEMMGAMKDWHARAHYLGRQAAGDMAPFGSQDEQAGESVVQEQAPYLDGFVDDIQRGAYKLIPDDLKSRTLMYPERMMGTANAGWVGALPPDTMINWKMSHAEHCIGCQSMAAHGPYRAGDMTEFPADGQTECIVNCKCYLVTSSGQEGLKKPGTIPLDNRGWPVELPKAGI